MFIIFYAKKDDGTDRAPSVIKSKAFLVYQDQIKVSLVGVKLTVGASCVAT